MRKEKTSATYGNSSYSLKMILHSKKIYLLYLFQWKMVFILLKHSFISRLHALIDMLVREYEEDQRSLKNSIQDLRETMPAPLAASFEKPCKETAVEEFVSRFAQRQ